MACIAPHIAGLGKRLIVDMGETVFFFDMNRNGTIDRVGTKHVTVRRTLSSTLRVTVAAAT